MADADSNEQEAQSASQQGRKRAGIKDFQLSQVNVLVTSMQQIRENAAFSDIDIRKSQAAAEAQVKVNAAQAGVGGASTDAIIGETHVNAEQAKDNVNRNAKSEQQQAEQNFVDSQINSENQVGRVAKSDSGNSGARHLLAFGRGFASGGGFNSSTSAGKK